MRMELTERELAMTVDLVNHTIHTGEDGPQPNMVLVMTSETANRFWQGKVSVPLAVGRGTIKITGALPKLIALLPTAKPIQQRYVETLRTEGRDDLLS